MARFDATDWCDLVRGVADPDSEHKMREHLALGNKGARRAVDALSRVAALARADQEMAVPEYAVRMAKAIGSVRRRESDLPSSSVWKFLPFEVTFDSLLEPALAGTRDLQASVRQLSFKSQGYTVDLRIDQDVDPRNNVVVGHVLAGEKGPRPVAKVPVLVAADGQVVERSLTSDFGEFQAEGLPRKDLDLYVLVDEDTCIKLPIGEAGEA